MTQTPRNSSWKRACPLQKNMSFEQVALYLHRERDFSCSQIAAVLAPCDSSFTYDKVRSKVRRLSGISMAFPGDTAQLQAIEAPVIDPQARAVEHLQDIVPTEEDIKSLTAGAKYDILRRQQKSLIQALAKQNAQYEMFMDVLREAVGAMTPITLPTPVEIRPTTDFEPESIGLQLSDIHVGEHVDSAFTHGLSEYSLNIFAHRVLAYCDRVVRMASIYRPSIPIDEIVIFIIGDLIHNETMRGSAKILADTTMPWQLMIAVRALCHIILTMTHHFKRVRVVCAPGNHGRLGKPGEEHPLTNLDYLGYLFLREILTTVTGGNSDRVSIEVPAATLAITDVQGKGFLCVHGETAKSWLGIPYYGVNRMRGRLLEIAQSLGVRFDYLLVGHHHQVAEWDSTCGGVLMNGAWPGPSTFSVGALHSAVPARQNFFLVHPKRGVHSISRIDLYDIMGDKCETDALSRFISSDATDWLSAVVDRGVLSDGSSTYCNQATQHLK